MRPLTVLALLLTAAPLVDAQGAPPIPAPNTLTKGTLKIAIEGTYAPFTYKDDKGNLTGYDVEFARMLAARLNLKPEFVLTEWSGILAGLQANKYDVIINQVGITSERQKTIAFSEPYTYSRPQIAVHATRGQEYKSLADLKGKRVGVPEYQQTAALWTRGVFQHEFGVRPEELHWFMERTEERSHGGATGFTPPPGVRFEYIPREKSIATMLLSGELDAAAHYIADRNIVDRSWVDLDDHPDVLPLFPDRRAESARYYQKTGLFPINHGMVVRRSIHEREPWVAINLFKAFNEAKELVRSRTQELAEPFFQTGRLEPAARKALAVDPFPYGVKSNRPVLETIARYSHEQGLTPRVLGLEEIFAPATMDL